MLEIPKIWFSKISPFNTNLIWVANFMLLEISFNLCTDLSRVYKCEI